MFRHLHPQKKILGGLNRIPCEEGMPSKTEWSTDQCINFLSVTKIEFNHWQLGKTQFFNHTLYMIYDCVGHFRCIC